jgi:two-component system nitrate/nitrite response regulator NarL
MPTPAQRIRILIADDHRIHREGLRRLLEGEPDFLVVGQAGTSAETLRLAQQLRPNVLLLDRSMPRGHGRDMLRELAAIESQVRTILITERVEQADVVTALQFGARGVITKDADSDILFRSVRKVMAGEYWISRAGVADLVTAVRSLLVHAREGRSRKLKITPRQQEIIASVVAGHSNKQIARQYSLSEDTVKRHLTNIFGRVGVSNRLELAMFAINHELTDTP